MRILLGVPPKQSGPISPSRCDKFARGTAKTVPSAKEESGTYNRDQIWQLECWDNDSKEQRTGRGLQKRCIEIVCVQETKWTGNSSREIGEGYKIYYGGHRTKKNGMGMIVIKDLQSKVIDCERTNNRIIKLRMIYGR